MVHGQKTSNY